MSQQPSHPAAQVRDYMSSSPITIGPQEPLVRAHAIMRQHRIRHLPVVDGDQLIGVVSLRDLHLIETLEDVEPSEVAVEDAMSDEPYCVSPEAPLAEVARQMAERRCGSALVLDASGKLIGMFTTTDALSALAAVLGAGGAPGQNH